MFAIEEKSKSRWRGVSERSEEGLCQIKKVSSSALNDRDLDPHSALKHRVRVSAGSNPGSAALI